MKTLPALVVSLLLFITINVNAQSITVPDPNFVNWLNSNGFASCMTGNQLDMTCPDVLTASSISCSNANISDLTGIEAFVNLYHLDCSHNMLTSLPSLPSSLFVINCSWNFLSFLPSLPPGLGHLDCGLNSLLQIPTLPNTLLNLYCYDNMLGQLPNLPSGFLQLSCENNQLLFLPNLPSGMNYLDCHNNSLQQLPALPDSLLKLICHNNVLVSLPSLPLLLDELQCQNNLLPSLPALPSLLEDLECQYNLLTSIPTLPNTLIHLNCSENDSLGLLPTLPPNLVYLNCGGCNLYSLPAIPSTITSLLCSGYHISSLPALPPILNQLDIRDNPLTCIPPIQQIGVFSCPQVLPATYCFSNQTTILSCDLPGPSFTPTLCTTTQTPVSIGTVGGNVKVCPGDTVTYTTPANGNVHYQWTVPTGATIIGGQTTNMITVVYDSAFADADSISVIQYTGCSSGNSFSKNIYRNIPHAPGLITGDAYGLCDQVVWQTRVYSVPSVAGITYHWTVPFGAIITNGQGTNIIGMQTSALSLPKIISVSAENGCGISRKRNLTIRGNPAQPLSISGAPSVCAHQQGVAYSIAVVPSAILYNWNVPKFASITSGQGTNTITVNFGTSSGNVRVRAINQCGVGSFKILPIAMPCRMEDENTEEFNIYPNPSTAEFTLTGNADLELRLFDITGKQLMSFQLADGEILNFGKELPSGIYMATLNSSDFNKTIRLVKK